MSEKSAAIEAVIATLDERLPDIAKGEPVAYARILDSVSLEPGELFVLRDTVALAQAEGTIDVETALILQSLLGGWFSTTTVAEKITALQAVAVLAGVSA